MKEEKTSGSIACTKKTAIHYLKSEMFANIFQRKRQRKAYTTLGCGILRDIK